MVSLLHLPQNIWRDNIVLFLRKIEELARLDSAVTNRNDRVTFHANISGSKKFLFYNSSTKSGQIKWFALRNIIADTVNFSKKPCEQDRLYLPQLLSHVANISFEGNELSQISDLICWSASTVRYICFSHTDVKDVSALAACKNLINLAMFDCSNVSDESFVKGVAGCVQLTHCTLHCCAKLRAASIVSLLRNCVFLTYLYVVGIIDLDQVLTDGVTARNLVHFTCVDWSHQLILPGSVMRAMATSFPCLDTLDLTYQHTTVEDGDMDVFARGCQRLTRIVLHYFPHITDAALCSIAAHLPRLNVIEIEQCERITDSGVITLAIARKSTLKELKLNHLSITDKAIHAVGTHRPALSILHVNYCRWLTDEAFSTLNVASLTSLDVTGTCVTGTFAKHVFSNPSTVVQFFYMESAHLNADFVHSLPGATAMSSFGIGPNLLTESDWLELSTKLPKLWTLIARDVSALNDSVTRSFYANCPMLHNAIIDRCSVSPEVLKFLKSKH